MTIYGVGCGGFHSYDTTAPARNMKSIRSLGCREIRYQVRWADIEPSPGEFNWTDPDWSVGIAAKHNLRVLPICYTTPSWIAPAQNAPPPPERYASFVRQAALRYGSGGSFWKANPDRPYWPIKHWELWNEANYGTAEWSGTAEQYADLYRAARMELKALNPNYEAILGGLAYPALDWLTHEVWDRCGEVDAVGWHPYGMSVKGTYHWISELVKKLDTYGAYDVPLDLTEVGMPVGAGHPYTEQVRAEYLRRMAETVREKERVRRLNIYTWLPPSDPFSIVHPDGTPKPSARAYGEGIGG